MKKLFKSKNEFILLFIIIILASVLRLWQLGQVPISLSDDEIRQVYSAYSFINTGKDAYGHFFPLIFNLDGLNYGPVSIYLSSLFFMFMKLSIFSGRFPYAIAGILSVASIYFLAKTLLKNTWIAILSSLTMSISLWHIQLSRLAHDASFSLFFYLVGITLFLRIKKGSLPQVFFSMFLLFLAFYSYAATRVIFIPFIILLFWYKFKDLTKKQFFIILGFALLTFGLFTYMTYTQKAADYGTAPFFFLDKQKTVLQVELQRRASSSPQLLKTIYHNKFTYWYKTFIDQYSYAFSPQFLFTSQEASGIYSIWGRGELYSFEALLIILGILYLARERKRDFTFLTLMLLASALPSGIGVNTPTYFTRSELMIPFLYIFIGAGIFSVNYFLESKRLRKLVYLCLIIVYIYSLGGYLVQYYYDWSRTNAKYFSKSTQDLVYALNNYKSKGKKVIVAGAGGNTFLHYAFYNKLDPKLVQANINRYSVRFDNFTFQKECLLKIPNNLVYIAPVDCKYEATPSSEIKTFDNSETVLNIYEK